MNFAQPQELDDYLREHPETQMLELLMPDMNGLLRCKRIQRREFAGFFAGAFSVPRTIPFLGVRGDMYGGQDQAVIGGDRPAGAAAAGAGAFCGRRPGARRGHGT